MKMWLRKDNNKWRPGMEISQGMTERKEKEKINWLGGKL